MNTRRLFPIFVVLMVIAMVVAFALLIASDDDNNSDGPGVTNDDALDTAVVTIENHRYHCIYYTTKDRGGLWCQEVGG